MDLNRIVSYSLRVGVLAGAVLSIIGLLLWGAQGFSPVDPSSGAGLLSAILQGSVVGVVSLGILVLVATPVFRVAVSVIFFAIERDGKYVTITLIVLIMLLVGLLFQAVA